MGVSVGLKISIAWLVPVPSTYSEMNRSSPVVALEVEPDHAHEPGHHEQRQGIAKGPRQLWHGVEVHAVDAGDQRRHHEHHGERGEPLHDRVQVVAGDGQVRLEHRGHEVAVQVQLVEDTDEVVIQVLVVGDRLVVDQLHIAAQQRVRHVPQRSKNASQLEQPPLQVQHLAQRLHAFLALDDPVLEGVDLLAQLVEQREVAVDHRVEERVEQAAGSPPDGVRALLEAAHHVLDHRGTAPVHRHDVARPGEDVDLPQLGSAAASSHLTGGEPGMRLAHGQNLVGHNDVLPGVAVDLGSLVAEVDVLLREGMNAQLVAQQFDLLRAWIADIQPYQSSFALPKLVDAVELLRGELPGRSIGLARQGDDVWRTLLHRAGVYSRPVADNVLS